MSQQGLPVVVINPTAPIGERDVNPTPTGKIIVDFMKGQVLAYIETGMNVSNVGDVAVGHVRAMEQGRIGEPHILGNQNLMLQQVFQVLSQLTGVSSPSCSIALGWGHAFRPY